MLCSRFMQQVLQALSLSSHSGEASACCCRAARRTATKQNPTTILTPTLAIAVYQLKHQQICSLVIQSLNYIDYQLSSSGNSSKALWKFHLAVTSQKFFRTATSAAFYFSHRIHLYAANPLARLKHTWSLMFQP